MKLADNVVYEEQVRSPPTRGAWIETPTKTTVSAVDCVAPHAGGVD